MVRKTDSGMETRGATVARQALTTAGRDQPDWGEIIQSLPVAMCVFDGAGRVIRWNDRAATLCGRLPEAVSSGDFGPLELLDSRGEVLPVCETPMAEVLATGMPGRDRELPMRRPDGSRIFVRASCEPLPDRAGIAAGGICSLQDISAAKTAEGSLQQLMQALPVAVYTTDAEGRITFFNDSAAALWGRNPEIGSTQWSGAWRLRTPDGQPIPHGQCPMAIALKENREIQWGRGVAERPDGTLVPFLAFPTPLHDIDGRLSGAVNTLIDLTGQPRFSEAAMHLAAIVESSMDAIVSKDMNGIITSWNRAAERLFGYAAGEAIGQSVTMLIPEDRLGEETEIVQKLRAGERVETFQTVRRRKDGTLIPVSLTISPVRDGRGHIVGASKIARDITHHKETERRIRLLMREVNHRVKNQYSVILSIIRETSRRWQDPVQFERHVRERIMALSDSHDLLVQADWKGSTIYELLRAQLTPFADSDRMSFSGPPVLLNPNAVQYLGIAFHELATNAAKFGALSNRTGRIKVDWQIVGEDDGEVFELTWSEFGGPVSTAANGAGFGTVVLLRVAPQAMGGAGEIVYGEAGLTWRFQAPLATIETSDKDR